jgi:uncharacterized protein
MRNSTSKRSYQARLSVVIPTLGSAADLHPLLSTVESQLGPEDEILVVQPRESMPEPVELSDTTHRTRVLSSPRGRGRQLNCGAAASRGNLLFFLHADCRVPSGFAESIRRVCSDPRVSVGCFRLGFSPCNGAIRWIAQWANLRTRWFGLPYGDQGLFCRREIWEGAGGFRLSHLMEDLDFVRHCKRLGRIHLLEETIRTSPRRYLECGIWKTSMLNHLIVFGYALGVDNRVLYDRYYHHRWRGCAVR